MSKLSKSQKFKIGVVTLFAFLAIGGSLTTLTACNTSKINNYTPNGDGRPAIEQVDEDAGGSQVNPYDNEDNNGGQVNPDNGGDNGGQVNPNDNDGGNNGGQINPDDNGGNNGGAVNPGTQDPVVDEEELAYQERVEFEDSIETAVKQKLNAKFEEELVEGIDIKYFTIEQDSQTFETSIFAHGTIKFTGDTSTHTFSLGVPLNGDSFNQLAPLYYVDFDEEKDLEANYSNDDLSLIKDFVAEQNLQQATAELDGSVWNLNMLTPAQFEKQFEEDFEAQAKEFFQNKWGTEYVKDVDFSHISTEYSENYGCYMLVLNGNTGNVIDDVVEEFCVKIAISQADYDYLNEYVLTTPVNQALNLKDNYKSAQLNQVKKVIDSKSSHVKFFRLAGMNYTVTQEPEQTL